MSNIQIVQAAFIQRKVQKEYEESGRDWLEMIAEEVEKIRNERRDTPMDNKKEAEAFCKENIKKIGSTKIIKTLMETFGYTYREAWDLLGSQKNKKKPPYNRESGKGLKAYLDKQDEEKQKAYERKMLEKELDRPKFFF